MNASNLPHIDVTVKLPRQMERVAYQVALGLPKKAVADMFGISGRTVENHVRGAMRKTGCKSIVELTNYFWCRQFHTSIIQSEGKRVIIATLFLLMLLFSVGFPILGTLRREKNLKPSLL